jgi:hypothetical protein
MNTQRGAATETLPSEEATAQELIILATEHGVDLGSICHSGGFLSQGRSLFLRRKNGLIDYNGQGPIRALPGKYSESASAFHGMWEEAGTFESMDQAFEFAKAWLLEAKEVDDLPPRSIRRCGI